MKKLLKFINSDKNKWVMYLIILVSFSCLFYQYKRSIQIYKNQVEILKNYVQKLEIDCQNIEKY